MTQRKDVLVDIFVARKDCCMRQPSGNNNFETVTVFDRNAGKEIHDVASLFEYEARKNEDEGLDKGGEGGICETGGDDGEEAAEELRTELVGYFFDKFGGETANFASGCFGDFRREEAVDYAEGDFETGELSGGVAVGEKLKVVEAEDLGESCTAGRDDFGLDGGGEDTGDVGHHGSDEALGKR